MATLGELRQYASEIAYDISDGKADRLINRWINQALQEITRQHDWQFYRTYARINLDVAVTGSDLDLVQDSTAVVFTGASTWLQKYVDEKWDLVVTGSDRFYQLTSITDTLNATLKTEQPWLSASETGASYTLVRYSYDLPTRVKRIVRVEDTESRLQVLPTTVDYFDSLRHEQPGHSDSYPRFCVIRDDKIEFWPGPSSVRNQLGVTYDRFPPLYTTASADATEVDWKSEWTDLLQKGIEVQAARHQGQNAQIPYPIARHDFEDCLADYRSIDAGVLYDPGGLEPILPWVKTENPAVYRNPIDLTDPTN
jgi:hypothetical protein